MQYKYEVSAQNAHKTLETLEKFHDEMAKGALNLPIPDFRIWGKHSDMSAMINGIKNALVSEVIA